jgi:hypothetical protein
LVIRLKLIIQDCPLSERDVLEVKGWEFIGYLFRDERTKMNCTLK